MRGRKHRGEDRFERWEAESMEKKADLRDERAGRGGGWESENGEISLELENMLFILVFFFLSRDSLVEPGRFGSVQSVSDFENQNRTESEIFCDFLISLIGFFSWFDFFGYIFSGFLGLIGFSVFLLTPTSRDHFSLWTMQDTW
jgi:hypothetical protein